MGQVLENEGDKHIIGILALRAGARLLENLFRFVANGAAPSIELLNLGIGGGGLEKLPFPREDVVELRLESVELWPVTARDRALVTGLIKKDRRLFELIEEKDHRAEEENQELHRHFDEGVKEQTDAA